LSQSTETVAPSPVTMKELELLKQTMQWSEIDDRHLRRAGEVLRGRAEELVDTWRNVISDEPHLARYSAFPDGRPNREYSAASRPRFVQWVIDACTRPWDRDWLNYQHEIGLRHTREKKNQTDQVESVDHIPYRYLLAFAPVILLSAGELLRAAATDADEGEGMCAAWTKSVMLHLTLWTRPYMGAGDW
jgi:hypothetical protein